jgi:hypothetical protein
MKQSTITQNNEGEVFFRHANPDERTVAQWKKDVYAKTGVNWAKPKAAKKVKSAKKAKKVKRVKK